MTAYVLVHAYCINLDREPEKFLKIKQEFKNYFEIERVSAIDASIENVTGIEALFQTTIQLFKKIILFEEEQDKEDRNNYVIIIEDDVYKCPDFDAYFPKICEFINNKENVGKWDFISVDNFLNFEKPKMEIYNDFLSLINNGFKKINDSVMSTIRLNVNFLKTF